MDQVLIGKFIAQERKRKNYTQKQLADILGISDKTVSKWERGNGFPEVSLLMPLCKELDITVNELLSGERVSEEDYIKKAEENMVNMIKEREENKAKHKLIMTIGFMSLIAFFTIMLVVSLYYKSMDLPIVIITVVIACLILIVGIGIAAEGDRKIGYFKCKNCDEKFVPGFADYSFAVHVGSARKLKCPHCGKRCWCKKVMSKED